MSVTLVFISPTKTQTEENEMKLGASGDLVPGW